MNVVLQDRVSGKEYRILNSHIPGDPNLPGRYEFADYVYRQDRTSVTTIALGDMNFNRDEMADAFQRAAMSSGEKNGFINTSSYWTNVGPNFQAGELFHRKTIDHIFIDNPTAIGLSPDDVLSGLQEMIDLLANSAK